MQPRFARVGALFALFTLLVSLIGPQHQVLAVDTQTDKTLETSTTHEVSPQSLVKHKAELVGAVPAKGDVSIIIHFVEAPLTLYTGGVAGINATNPAANNATKLDLTSPASVAYLNHLEQQHTAFFNTVRSFSPKVSKLADYRVAFNGMALRLPVQDLGQLRTLPAVRLVEVDTIQQLTTDSSNEFIGSPAFWNKIQTVRNEEPGAGVVVGIIDSGIYHPSTQLTNTGAHPSLTDPAPDGYDFPAPAGGYKGVCAATSPQPQDGSFGECNDKLIGAWWYNAGTADNPGEMMSPMDEDGHGTHTATTAAGNHSVDSPFGELSGVAPYAQVIAYKVCWSGDPDISDDGGCASTDSTSAIEQAVIDGVDVLNFSISGGNSPWTESVEQAFFGASAAGVIVNASGGNSGPAQNTVGHNSPWLITVAASTQSRKFEGSLVVSATGAPQNLEGSSLYYGVVTGTIKLAPPQTAGDSTPSQCLNPYAPGTFAPTDIVICRRGTIARVLKYKHVFAGGAGGAILVNQQAGQSLNAEYCDKVCLHLPFTSGQALIDFIAANPGTEGTLYGGTKQFGRGDIMAGFSSRGQSKVLDLIKPDVTLVGVDVIAGETPFIWDEGFEDGLLFKPLSGTSMSSPHSAGTSALMRQMFPDWTPYEVKSAMMTTAYTDTLQPDGLTPTIPFDDGSGRVDLTKVFSAGLVLDEAPANFVAADPAADGRPSTLNLASMANNACIQVCSWTRTVSSTMDTAVTWTAMATETDGMTITVEPASFTLDAFGTQQITVTADVQNFPVDVWTFGEFALVPDNTDTVMAHFPIAARPALAEIPEELVVVTRRDSGSETFDGFQAVAVTDGQYEPYGLVEGMQTIEALAGDSSNGSAYDDLTDGVFYTTFQVPSGTVRLVAEIIESQSLDIDLFLARDANNDGIPQESEEVAMSATGAVLEEIDILSPAAGTYFAIVQNWGPSPNQPDLTTLSVAIVPNDNEGNFDVEGPSTVPAGQEFEVLVQWDEPAMEAGDKWYGAVDLGTNPADPDNLGRLPVDVIRLGEDEISKTVNTDLAMSGDTVTYTLTITNYGAISDTFRLTDTLPDGLVVDPTSITGGATYDPVANTITWSGELGAPTTAYTFTDSRTGGRSYQFVDITQLSNTTDVCNFSTGFASCDESAINYSIGPDQSIKYYGQQVETVRLWTNGFMQLEQEALLTTTDYFVAQDLPDTTMPNAVYAGLWTDLDLDGTSATDTGGGSMFINLVDNVNTAEPSVPYVVVQYENAQQFQLPNSDLNFNLIARADGLQSEFCAIYGSVLNGNLTTFGDGVSVGIENIDGTQGASYYFNGQPAAHVPAPNATVCAIDEGGAAQTHTITYAASAVVTGTTTFTNNVVLASENVPGTVDDSATVRFVTQLPSITLNKTVGTDSAMCATSDAITVTAGTEVTYCYEVTNTGAMTLTNHMLVDDQLGVLLQDFSYDLAPGASVFITQTATISTTTMNTAVWTATGDDDLPATAEDSAMVMVEAAPEEYMIYLPIVRK